MQFAYDLSSKDSSHEMFVIASRRIRVAAEIYFKKFDEAQMLPLADACVSGEVLKIYIKKIHLVKKLKFLILSLTKGLSTLYFKLWHGSQKIHTFTEDCTEFPI